MVDKTKKEASGALTEKDVSEYAEVPETTRSEPVSRGKNWLASLAIMQHVKEIAVIVTVIFIICKLVKFLEKLVSKAAELMERAAGGGPVAIEVVSKIDWHLLGLAIALVMGLSLISVMLLRSVFRIQDPKTPDGLSLSDMPTVEVFKTTKSAITGKD